MQEPDNTTLVISIGDPKPVRDLTREEARSLLEMFSDMAQRYNPPSLFGPRGAQRLITAQRPFYERYRYKPHNGTQEMARRRRHMDRTKPWANPYPSLLFTGTDSRRYHVNSHGEVCPFPGVNRRDKSTVS